MSSFPPFGFNLKILTRCPDSCKYNSMNSLFPQDHLFSSSRTVLEPVSSSVISSMYGHKCTTFQHVAIKKLHSIHVRRRSRSFSVPLSKHNAKWWYIHIKQGTKGSLTKTFQQRKLQHFSGLEAKHATGVNVGAHRRRTAAIKSRKSNPQCPPTDRGRPQRDK
jgi:hypothetical protein